MSQRKHEVFVAMEASEPYDALHASVIRPIVEESGLEAYHAAGLMLEEAAQGIRRAKLVIAEVTPANPNVYYELGYAHALGKPTLLLARRDTKLPFDLSVHQCLFYDATPEGMQQLTVRLRKYLYSYIF
jgi:nucleoside 2-deoxyribosyltransferase